MSSDVKKEDYLAVRWSGIVSILVIPFVLSLSSYFTKVDDFLMAIVFERVVSLTYYTFWSRRLRFEYDRAMKHLVLCCSYDFNTIIMDTLDM